jgi:phosphoribosylformylglycinamidine cyclo-ligase
MDYRSSGVDIDAGNEVVRRIKQLARGTHTPGVLSEIGSFGGLFDLRAAGLSDPVLVASADGVGTKLKLAFLTGIHTTIGEDLVNHCVNDILVQGAVPLFFLDYLATGRLAPDVAAAIVEGIARACRTNGCALLGGETAEMPGFYQDGEYDLAGFIIGAVERARIIDGRGIAPGDVLIGLPSTGLHTNGYSLARRIVFEHLGLTAHAHVPELQTTVGEALLAPHRSYLPVIKPLLGLGLNPDATAQHRTDPHGGSGGSDRGGQPAAADVHAGDAPATATKSSADPNDPRPRIKGLAHITGGGITDNLPRILPEGTSARISRAAWEPPALFRWLVSSGQVPFDDAYRTFNMGIGLIVACAASDAERMLAALRTNGEADPRLIGEIIPGARDVQYD